MPNIINAIHKYRPRGAWQQRTVKNIQKLVIHHSAADASNNPEERLNQIMGWHLANSPQWMGLSYHYVITKNGNIYQTNNHEDLTWHDGVNSNSLAILVDGYFHAPNNNQPTNQQLESLEFLLTELSTKHPEFPAGNNPLQDILGHRDVSATACPGDILYPKMVEIKQKINQKINSPQTAKTEPNKVIPESQKIETTSRIFENNFYQNAYDRKDVDWIIGSLLDRDLEIQNLKSQIEKLEKLPKNEFDFTTPTKINSQDLEKLQTDQNVKEIPKTSQNENMEVKKNEINKIDKDVIFGWVKNNILTVSLVLGGFGYTGTQDQIIQSASIAAPIIAFVATVFMEKIYKLKSLK